MPVLPIPVDCPLPQEETANAEKKITAPKFPDWFLKLFILLIVQVLVPA